MANGVVASESKVKIVEFDVDNNVSNNVGDDNVDDNNDNNVGGDNDVGDDKSGVDKNDSLATVHTSLSETEVPLVGKRYPSLSPILYSYNNVMNFWRL
jgi:hypothetical protein